MKESDEKNNKALLVRLANQLLKEQQDLDHLAVQIALGKSKVIDLFEEAKVQMKKRLQEFKKLLPPPAQLNDTWFKSLNERVDHLEEMLNKGKAKTKVLFQEQKKNIIQALDKLKNLLKQRPELIKFAGHLTGAMEKLKLQMDLFEKKMGAEKKKLTKEFKAEMYDAAKKVNSIVSQVKSRQHDAGVKWEHFNDEIKISYAHLKKAIKSL
ncbi:MAG TPA: hypothetical protein PKM27_05165 [Saprospiraceae bacterium]|nr:hypothetical protein [Saprospiraceae bacterium]HNT20783.1 hypothetical protein [Saprospiraceae bacterium]